LLTISSIFLCGIVVTYVANADNYRQLHISQRAAKDSLQESVNGLTKQLNDKIAEKNDLEDKLGNQITSLKIELDELKGQLQDAEREKAKLLNRVDKFAANVETFTKTNADNRALLEDTIKTWKTVEADLIKEQSQHKETSRLLLEKLAIIQTLETEKKQLLEEQFALQGRLDKLLQPTGKIPTIPVTVTSEKDIARPAPVTTRDISLKGLVTAVDLKNKMVGISIGIADGVREGMKFHVTRGDNFICDILIIDTDAEEAVGAIELVQEQPKVGDTISTNL
jgi:archaellum component FlaC